MSWDGLVSRWKELATSNQYLGGRRGVRGERAEALCRPVADRAGQRRALQAPPGQQFEKFWHDIKGSQDLIDLEVIETSGEPQFLGVWRRKQAPRRSRRHGPDAFWVDLTWEQLLAKHKELGETQYLADVETYMRGDQRRYAGVWRVGSGNGAFFVMYDWAKFAAKKQELNDTQQMLDFEMYQSTLGTWHFLGVWRRADSAGPLHASTSTTKFDPLTREQFARALEEPAGEGDAGGAHGGGAGHSAGDVAAWFDELPLLAIRTATRARRTSRHSSSWRSRTGSIAHGSAWSANSWSYTGRPGLSTRRSQTRGGLSTHWRG